MMNSAAVIVRNREGKVLLQMRDGQPDAKYPLCWGLWGGGIEEDDASPLVAAQRELAEELGVQAAQDDLKLVLERVREDGVRGYYFALLKPLEWREFVVLEGAGAAFFRLEEIQKLPTTNQLKWLLATHPELLADKDATGVGMGMAGGMDNGVKKGEE